MPTNPTPIARLGRPTVGVDARREWDQAQFANYNKAVMIERNEEDVGPALSILTSISGHLKSPDGSEPLWLGTFQLLYVQDLRVVTDPGTS